jgi:hypothetical protein
MTKTALIAEVANRLGDSTTGFLTILGTIFDEVLRELAARGAVKQARQTASSAWLVAGTMSYSTRTITGISSPDWPLDVISLRVPMWQAGGFLERFDDETFEGWRHACTDSTGTAIRGYPRGWRLYPNETQLQVIPVPDSTADDATVETLYLKPLTALSGSDDIVQLRQEHIPWLLQGCIKYGAVFQDETRTDVKAATQEFEIGIRRMIGEAGRTRGRATRARYRDV